MKSNSSAKISNVRRTLRGPTLLGISVALSAAAMLASNVVVADYSSTRDLTVTQRPIVELQPEAPAFEITASLSQPDGEYHFGDVLTINVVSSRDAYVTVLNVGTSGKVHIVFPNEFQKDNKVKAGETVVIPETGASFDLKIGPPAGVEVIKVIATLEPDTIIDPEEVVSKSVFPELKKQAPAVVRDISVALRENHEKGWAEDTIFVTVKP